MTATVLGSAPASRLTDDEADWRRHVRDVARSVVGPRVGEMDRAARLDDGVLAELFSAGLMGVEVHEAYGGAGRGPFHVMTAIEELARVDPAVAVVVDVQNALVISALTRHGSGDQRRRHLPRLASTTVASYAISEADAGSDAFSMSTTARPDGDGWVLSGRKQWITNAAEAELFMVFARTGEAGPAPRLTAFLVERDAPGLTVGDRVDKMGIRASSTCEVAFDDVRLRGHDVLGRPYEGNQLLLDTLEIGKLGIAAQLVGLAQGALDEALSYAELREQFGRPIIDFQGVGFPLAGLAAELEAARALLYDATRWMDGPRDATDRLRVAAMAKYVASRVAERTASQAVETLGGIGFSAGSGAEKFYRDAKVGAIYEGTSNMQFRTILSVLRPEGPPPEAVS